MPRKCPAVEHGDGKLRFVAFKDVFSPLEAIHSAKRRAATPVCPLTDDLAAINTICTNFANTALSAVTALSSYTSVCNTTALTLIQSQLRSVNLSVSFWFCFSIYFVLPESRSEVIVFGLLFQLSSAWSYRVSEARPHPRTHQFLSLSITRSATGPTGPIGLSLGLQGPRGMQVACGPLSLIAGSRGAVFCRRCPGCNWRNWFVIR